MAINKTLVWEVLRKLVHLASVFILIAYTVLLYYFSDRVAILTLTALLLILFEIEHIRLEHKPRLAAMFNALFRKQEENHIASSIYVIISIIICFAAFDYPIALLSMLMAIFGDAFAAIFGTAFGKVKLFREKTVIGTLSGFAANVICGVIVLPDFLYLFLPMAISASLIELFTNKVGDNLTMPIFTGFIGQMIIYIFEINLPGITWSSIF